MIPAQLHDNTQQFCPLALGDWLDVCRSAAVPFVPAEHVTDFETADLQRFEQAGPHQARLAAAWDALEAVKEVDTMLRWDLCSSYAVKVALSAGQADWQEDFLHLTPDDVRFFDLMCRDWPRILMPVWKRPWVKARRWLHYPVEYRAFVRDRAVVGVSNYYPQRPLRYEESEVSAVIGLTERLVSHVRTPLLLPSSRDLMPRLPFVGERPPDQRQQVEFSADFLVREDGAVLFLEGAPLAESHPCCFDAGPPDGLALSKRTANPLADGVSVWHPHEWMMWQEQQRDG